MTLAYKGLPQALEECKCALQDTYASLPAENPGAKWPKTTLGCLRDTARLTSVQFGQLKQLCEEVQRQLIAVDAVVVDSVDLVVYECRSLERVLGSQQVGLRSPSNGQPSAPTAEAVAVVERVVREWEAEDYWFHASKDGNREGHYRGRSWVVEGVWELNKYTPIQCTTGPHVGVTLATWIARDGPQRSANALLLGVLRSFKRQVDTLLPNMYTWFDESALHVTLRNVKD